MNGEERGGHEETHDSPLAIHGEGGRGGEVIREAPLACVVPLCLTAFGCVLLFFFADGLYALLAPIAAR
jgi:multicomponent Na+:H+ antiporter subunit D